MSDLIVALLLGALVVQLPIGILVYVDAKRLDLKDPEVYGLGVLVPAGGLVVILYYFSERKNLPERETERP